MFIQESNLLRFEMFLSVRCLSVTLTKVMHSSGQSILLSDGTSPFHLNHLRYITYLYKTVNFVFFLIIKSETNKKKLQCNSSIMNVLLKLVRP